MNRIPNFDDKTGAAQRRIKSVPFNVSFPADKRDKKLREKLVVESSGILNWALEGFKKWSEKGFSDLAESEAEIREHCSAKPVERKNEVYNERLRTVKQFIQDECLIVENFDEQFSTLWTVWEQYCSYNEIRGHDRKGRDTSYLSQNQFSALLTDLGFPRSTIDRIVTGKDGKKRRKRIPSKRGIRCLQAMTEEERTNAQGIIIEPVKSSY